MGDYVPGQSVAGRCPACDRQSLFLGDGGHVTCGWVGRPACPDPGAASDLLTDLNPPLRDLERRLWPVADAAVLVLACEPGSLPELVARKRLQVAVDTARPESMHTEESPRG